jgi:hypothetical protein
LRKRLLVVFVVGLLVGAMVLISGPSQATSPVSRLRRRVARLENRLADLESVIYPCLSVQGMTSYGDPAGSYGYLYSPDGVAVGLTSALDYDDGGSPQVWTAIVAPECVAPSVGKAQGLYSPLKPGTFKPRVKPNVKTNFKLER